MTGQTTVRRFERQGGSGLTMTAVAGVAWITDHGELMIGLDEDQPIGPGIFYGIDLTEQPHGSNRNFRQELHAATGEDVPF